MSHKAIEQLLKNWQKNLFDNYDAIEHLREARGIRTAGIIKSLEFGLAQVPEKEELPPEIYKSLKSFELTDPGISGMVSLPLRRRTGMTTNFCFLDLNGSEDKPFGDAPLWEKMVDKKQLYMQIIFNKDKEIPMATLHEKYIVDDDEEKSAVILSIDEYNELLEDLHDLTVIVERKDNETIPFDEVKKRFK